jgi:hypothetical protein
MGAAALFGSRYHFSEGKVPQRCCDSHCRRLVETWPNLMGSHLRFVNELQTKCSIREGVDCSVSRTKIDLQQNQFERQMKFHRGSDTFHSEDLVGVILMKICWTVSPMTAIRRQLQLDGTWRSTRPLSASVQTTLSQTSFVRCHEVSKKERAAYRRRWHQNRDYRRPC